MTKHRLSGRTGRAGKQGIAITFLTNDDDEVMYVVYAFLPGGPNRDGANGRFVCLLSVGTT
jgi:superfamily II DNA/RNA helicase